MTVNAAAAPAKGLDASSSIFLDAMLIGFLVVCSLSLMVLLPSWPSPVDTPPLIWAAQFISDGIVGFFIALAFWLLPLSAMARDQPASKWIPFRKFADLTFPIYVLHFPCLVLCRAVIPQGQNMYANMVAGFLITLLVCSVLGFLLEKTHPWWKRAFKKIINRYWEKFGTANRQAPPTGEKA